MILLRRLENIDIFFIWKKLHGISHYDIISASWQTNRLISNVSYWKQAKYAINWAWQLSLVDITREV